MKNRFYFNKFSALFLLATLTAFAGFAQSPNSPVPRQEKLLNGLKVLVWNDAKAEKVSVKIRVHSGSSFDPQGREGVMQMLADNIFPNESVKEFFTDDLGGSLEITTNHDYIQIDATAKSDEFLTMLETLANAVSKPTINKETTAKLRSARLEKLKELEKNPAYVADLAVAKKLLGTFPYGRPVSGTTESLQKIDYADLIFAKDRFFTADNATVAVTGNIKPELVFRAVRRYLGSWAKSNGKIASTFRQPDEPDTKPFEIEMLTIKNPEIRYALRGLARNDADFAASKILTKILQTRLEKAAMPDNAGNFFARQDEHILPGLLILGYTTQRNSIAPNGNQSKAVKSSNSSINPALLFSQTISSEEFSKAKAEALAELNAKNQADWWLDADTFRLGSVSEEMKIFNQAALADVQKVAGKLSKNPIVSVTITQAAENTTTKN
ncbi:MAG: insulinase family protein [Pyrinomonadaceae bacterium]|nr:insulinase family protein [Pyrinomonadaceae bacterium]